MPTNVLRFYNALAESGADGVEQRRYYHPGIGTDEITRLERIWAGMTGSGLTRNIKSAYAWLAENYSDGDEIYLVGFSRGAFTARSLSGLISQRGVPRQADWALVDKAYRDASKKSAGFDEKNFLRARIHFLGVWDTVGALGIPPEIDWLPLWLLFAQPRFHNTDLSPAVTHAYHALAADEERRTFSPTLWTSSSPSNEEVIQMWFAGVHADVGGGYKETGLSDNALRWMIDRAAAVGAGFLPHMLEQIGGDDRGVLHDSMLGVFKNAIAQPRRLPDLDAPLDAGPVGQQLHLSLANRRGRPPISQAPYRDTIQIAVGERREIQVFAQKKWNWTGLYVKAGESYRFEAAGSWLHRKTPIGPGGSAWPGRLLPWNWWRRCWSAPWMSLVGAVADFANPDQQGKIRPLETFGVGNSADLQLSDGGLGPVSGYLYMYANDREGGFKVNRGSLRVTVTRVR